MRVLFLSARFKPDIGGVETHVYEVAKRLVDMGHEVNIITEDPTSPRLRGARGRPHFAKASRGTQNSDVRSREGRSVISKEFASLRMTERSLKIHRLNFGKPGFFKKFMIWWAIYRVRPLIQNADIIHCHDVFIWYFPFRFLYPTKPIYTTFHGYETQFPPRKKAIFIRKISEKLSRGNIIVGDYIKKWYGTQATYVTYGATSKVQSSKSKLQKKSKVLKILLIGRLEEDIGVKTYLKVLDILKKKKVKFRLDVCGDGSIRAQVERYGVVHGFVNNIDPYIKKADVIFASSYLSILKALSYHKLVIATYENELKKDYLNMAPFAKWIIVGNSPAEITQKVLNTPLRQGFEGRAEYRILNTKKLEDFLGENTWDEVVKLYIKLWDIKK